MKNTSSFIILTSLVLTSATAVVVADEQSSAGTSIEYTLEAKSEAEAEIVASDLSVTAPSDYLLASNLTNFAVLTPQGEDGFSLRHRVLVPLLKNAAGHLELTDGQPAFLEFYDRSGLSYLPLQVNLDSEFDLGNHNAALLTPHGAPNEVSFAIALASSEEGGIDWSIAPIMFDPKHIGSLVIPYDVNALVTADSTEETEGDDEEDPGLLEVAADAVRDALVEVWDGISGGLASIGWGSGGAIDTINDTLSRANGGS